MERSKVVVAGTGLPEIIRLLQDFCEVFSQYEFIGFVDDNHNNASRDLYGYPFLGPFDFIRGKEVLVINSIGRNCEIRHFSTQKLLTMGAQFFNLIHPSVVVDAKSIGIGNIIDRNTVIHRGVSLGSHNLILTEAMIGHDSKVGDFNFIGHRVTLNGFVNVGNLNYLGGHSIIAPNVKIGTNCSVGMSCSISSNLADGARLVARPPTVL